MKNILIIILAIITSILVYSCNNDVFDDQIINPDPVEEGEVVKNPLILKGAATVSGAIKTKAALVETMDGATQVLRFEWEEGDKIELGFIQEGKEPKIAIATVTDLTSDKRTANFSVVFPEEIDGDFTLFAYYGAGSLDQSNPAKIILPDAEEFAGTLTDQVRLLSMWDKKDMIFDGETLPEISINFKHLGSIMSLHVENTGNEPLNDVSYLELEGTNNWLYNETSRAIFNMASGTFTDNLESSKGEGNNMFVKVGEAINAGDTKTFYRWFVPGDFEEGLQLGLLAKNMASQNIGQSDMKITPNLVFETGINYGLHITMNGDQINFAGVIPKTIITTNAPIGDTINVRMQAAIEYRSDIWLDLNNNGIRDSGEDPAEFILGTSDLDYIIESQTITIYGNIRRLEITNSQLTYVDISNNPFLEVIDFRSNELTNIDISKNTNLTQIIFNSNPLITLDITKNIKLETIYAQTTQLSSLDVSNNPELRYLNLQSSQFSSFEEINSIYTQLPDRTGLSTKGYVNIRYGGNRPANADHDIAKNKNWDVAL